MRKGFILSVMSILSIAVLALSAGLYAAANPPDVIELGKNVPGKKTQPLMTFSHLKHSQEYAKADPSLFKNGCGECHHDANNKPLTNLKPGDAVKPCIDCHKEPGLKPSREKLNKKERIKKYYGEAVHENCTSCHSQYNKMKKLKASDKKAAPIKSRCNNCHKR